VQQYNKLAKDLQSPQHGTAFLGIENRASKKNAAKMHAALSED
jgi:hypothetical protein